MDRLTLRSYITSFMSLFQCIWVCQKSSENMGFCCTEALYVLCPYDDIADEMHSHGTLRLHPILRIPLVRSRIR
jgi:hypothetical protein